MFAKYVYENYRYIKTSRFFTFQLYVCLGSGSCFSLSQTRVRTTSWFGLKYLFLVETSCDKYPCFGCNKMGNCPEFLLKISGGVVLTNVGKLSALVKKYPVISHVRNLDVSETQPANIMSRWLGRLSLEIWCKHLKMCPCYTTSDIILEGWIIR